MKRNLRGFGMKDGAAFCCECLLLAYAIKTAFLGSFFGPGWEAKPAWPGGRIVLPKKTKSSPDWFVHAGLD